MSGASTSRMIEMYVEEAEAPMFLSGFFQSPPQNFHTTEFVELDIVREDEDVAVVITDLTVGANENEASTYTNKQFKPPIFKEKGTITAYDLMTRMPGQNPFEDPNFGANATLQAFGIFRKLERKIKRAIEIEASQVFQTGALTCIDSGGVARYTLDFVPKAAHMVTAGVTAGYGAAWLMNGTGTRLADIALLAKSLRQNGKRQPKKLLFGSNAFELFKAGADVKEALNKTGQNTGELAPVTRGMGATFQGFIWTGHYRFEMWTYDGFYKHQQTGVPTPYIDDNNIIMLSDGARLDLSFGAIPMMRRPEASALPFLPGRISDGERGVDLTTNAWFTEDGEHLKVSAGTRPLTIPTAIDTFGRLKVA
jgi:hypothetical protein